MSELINKILMEAGVGTGQLKGIFDIANERPFAIYNADEKKLVGIFASGKLANKYVYGMTKSSATNISTAATKKSIIAKNRNQLGYNVAIRYATPEQINKLEGKQYFLANNASVTNDYATNAKFKYDAPDALTPEERQEEKERRKTIQSVS